MNRMIFVNLPVANLPESIAFYESLGFQLNPRFSDDTAACMIWSESIYVMLLTHAKWRSFTNRPLPAKGASEVALALALESRTVVDELVKASADHGGTADVNPANDLGFMYQRSFTDPDGHVWEPFWMDPAAIPADDKLE